MKLIRKISSRLFNQNARDSINRWVLRIQQIYNNQFFNFQPIRLPFRPRSSFRSWHDRPVRSRDVSYAPSDNSHEDFAIVVQGKLSLKANFTLETLRIYQKAFPGVLLVLSTWENESPSALGAARQLGVHVVTSKPPARDPSGSTRNLQIVSTVEGLKIAGQLGAKYALKTRTDQRIYNNNSLALMRSLLECHKISESDSRQKPTSRIVVLNLGTLKYRLYSLSDFLQFGLLSDLKEFWNPDLLAESQSSEIIEPPEVFLCRSYLARTGWKLESSIHDWWTALGERFIVVDHSSLDFFWPKYGSKEYRSVNYKSPGTFDQFSFAEWHVIVDRGPNPLAEGVVDPLF